MNPQGLRICLEQDFLLIAYMERTAGILVAMIEATRDCVART